MKPVKTHQPGKAAALEPPSSLLEIADSLSDPVVKSSGVTTTADGRWALYVTVPPTTDVPIASVESHAQGFPVVYEAQPSEPPRAGPAYPGRKR